MASILYKIKAVNLLFNTNGVTTPGIDDVKVKHVLTQTDKPEKALKILENRIKYLKIEISLAKGKTDQAINRKTLEGLNKYELKRRYYKSTEGKIKINNYRNELKNILSNPIQYIKEFNNEVIKNNNAIR
jgi:tRNA pseudouridine-54 N-methylase